MAEYYPLLAKAVSALDLEATEARHALYDRARKALIGQLRAASPALADSHIDSESRALDLAVARIEAEIAVRAAIRGMAPASPAPFYPPAAPPANPEHWAATPPPASETRPAPPPPRLPVPPPAPRPTFAPQPPLRPAAPTITPIAAAPEQPVADTDADASIASVLAPPARPANGGRPNPLRPAAPAKAEQRQRTSLRGLVVTLAILAVVGVVAAAAWWLKQSQDELARKARTPEPAATENPAPPPGKIGDRIGGKPGGPAPSPPVTPSAPTPAPPVTPPAPAPAPAADSGGAPAETPIAPVKVQTKIIRAAPPQVAPANSIPETEAAAQPGGAAPAPGIAVAQRAAILVDAPEETSRVKTYAGTVVWKVEQVKREGKPPSTALRADIDIPSARALVTMKLQKNEDASLPASHMMELRFTPASGSEIPGVKLIAVPEMRKEESPVGEPLTGAPVPVVENFFIIGLSKGDSDIAHNIELLSTRNWIDVQLQLGNKKNAKLTFEKGPAGERALAEALAAWK